MPHRVLVILGPTGAISGGLGRASMLAVARVEHDDVVGWERYDVDWQSTHDQLPENARHERIVRFVSEHAVEAVVAAHVGPGARMALRDVGVPVFEQAGISGHAAAVSAAAVLDLGLQPTARNGEAGPDGA